MLEVKTARVNLYVLMARLEKASQFLPVWGLPKVGENYAASALGTEPLHCIPLIDDAVPLRRVGMTELLPDLILKFRGHLGEHKTADIWVGVNTNVTSQLSPQAVSETTLSIATEYCVTRLPKLSLGMRGIQVAVNAVVFLEVPLHELLELPPSERNLRVSNLRVNAWQIAGPANARIQLYLKVSDTTVTPDPVLPIATTGPSFTVEVSTGAPQVDLSCLKQSQSLNDGLLGHQRRADTLTALVKFSGKLTPSEPVGHRTRLRVHLAGIPQGVSMFATTQQVASAPASLSAALTAADSLGFGPFQPAGLDGHIAISGGVQTLSKIDLQSGNGVAVWELDGGSSELAQEISVGLVAAYCSDTARKLPYLGSSMVRGTLGPFSTVTTASVTAPIPRFADESVSLPFFSIVE